MDQKVSAIIRNFENRSKDIKDANEQIKRMEKIYRKSSPPHRVLPRNVIKGPKGGLFYVQNGHRIYLSVGQCHRCESGNLNNVVTGCPPVVLGHCAPTRTQLKHSLARSERKRRSLKRKLKTVTYRKRTCKEKLKQKKQQLHELREQL